MMIKTKKRKIAPTSTAPSPLPTTTTSIANLPDDVVADILLRLPSAAAIYRAVLASAHWIRVASTPAFLRLLRDAHDDALLLGHFVSPDGHGHGHGSTPPSFFPAPLQHSREPGPDSDRDILAAMVRRGDFFMTRVLAQAGSARHVLEDVSGGLLLFSDDAGALRVFDPMTHRVSSVGPLPKRWGKIPDHRGRRVCLLPIGSGSDSDDPDAFRVMSLQHGNRKKMARLDVYDSRTRSWLGFPGAGIPARCKMDMIYRRQYSPAMHAGDRVFWKYEDTTSSFCSFSQSQDTKALLSLDTKTMTFSDVHLPPGVTQQSAYAVGETEDGTCCLVEVGSSSPREMQVWRFKLGDDREGTDGDGAQVWELEQQVPLILGTRAPSQSLNVACVRAIVGGIVLLCFNNSSLYQPHIAFRLKSLKVEAEFTCRGVARPFVIK